MTGMRFLFVLAMLGANGAIAAEDQSQSEAPALRQRAEDLARAASQRFTEILDTGKQTRQSEPSATQADGKGSPTPYARVVDWLARSSKSYDDIVIAELKSKDGWTTLVQRSGADAPAPAASGAAPELRGWSGLVELLRYWLARANSAYRNEIVQPLRVPNGGTAPGPIQRAEQPKPTVAPSGAAPVAASDSEAAKRKQAEEQIKREAEAADRLRHAQEARRAADEELARLKAQQEKAAAERRAEEEKRLAAAAEEKRKAQAEARARLIAEAEARRKAEAAAEAEAKRKAEAEQKRIAAEAEEKRKAAAAEEQRKAEAEKQRLAAAAETKRQAEEADAAERRAVAQAEAEAKRQAEIDAEATRRSEAAAKAKAAARASVAVQPALPSTAPASSPSAATTPPQSQPVKKAERQDSQRSAVKENSAISLAPTAPERKPQLPQGSAKATPKKREEVIVAEAAQPQPAKSGKQAKRVVSKKHKQAAYAYAKPRYKQHHVYKASHGKRGKAHIRKHRTHGAHKVFVVRGCRCICGSYIQRPRKHHWGRVIHRHRIHYID